jgi:RHS repeat-associated protein
VKFWYGSDGARYKRVEGGKTTYYLGNVEIEVVSGVSTIKRTLAGVYVQTLVNGSTTANNYLFHDQLGNLARITDASGNPVNSMDYAAFGTRRDWSTQGGGGQVPTLTTRGFTGQEHIDGNLGLMHFNARMYDPSQGRFLQPDQVIQSPDNAQSWNPYSYCLNNPLTYTDPTGMMSIGNILKIVVAIVITVYTGGAAAGAWSFFGASITAGSLAAYGVAALGGFAAGVITTGTLKGGLIGAFGAALTLGIGNMGNAYNWGNTARTFAQAAGGGIMSSLQGGRFGDGFVSAGLTAAVMPQIGKIQNDVGRTITGALAGGTISEITGGKFANGAMSGAIQAAMAKPPVSDKSVEASADVPQDLSGVPTSELREKMLSDNPLDRVEAARVAIKQFDIEGSGYSLSYDPTLMSATANVDPFGNVVLGPGAYKSWSFLGSTLGHEIEIHWMKQMSVFGNYTDTQDFYLREVQAHRYNVLSASRFGNSPIEINFYQHWANSYYGALIPSYKTLANHGIYHDPAN